MKMCENAGFIHIKKTAVVLLCLCLSALFSVCTAAEEKDDKEVIRVGWYESSFNHADAAGNRSGYGYEYQMKIAAYTGWKYEYVTGSWVELLQMLEDGTIDLLSDVSFTEERAEKMLFSSLPMGTEEYYLFTSWHNREISASDYSS